jgi:uncharacterized membrane protein YesL
LDIAALMKPTTVTATAERPNRILVALAAAWMIGSLALGGIVSGQAPAEAAAPAQVAADEAALP